MGRQSRQKRKEKERNRRQEIAVPEYMIADKEYFQSNLGTLYYIRKAYDNEPGVTKEYVAVVQIVPGSRIRISLSEEETSTITESYIQRTIDLFLQYRSDDMLLATQSLRPMTIIRGVNP